MKKLIKNLGEYYQKIKSNIKVASNASIFITKDYTEVKLKFSQLYIN